MSGTLSVDGKKLMHYVDRLEPAIMAGRVALGVSSNARVTITEPRITAVEAESIPAKQPHVVRLSARSWLGGLTWVFDGDEPILELHDVNDPSCFAKLKPGYKPQMTFDSHWGLENQGAFPEAASKWTAPVISGGGESLKAAWSARSVKDRFTTNSSMTVGFAMKLGPASFGKATLSKAGPLAKGRYGVTALVKSVNTFGPGGRIDMEATQAETNRVLTTANSFSPGTPATKWKKPNSKQSVITVRMMPMSHRSRGRAKSLIRLTKHHMILVAAPGFLLSSPCPNPQWGADFQKTDSLLIRSHDNRQPTSDFGSGGNQSTMEHLRRRKMETVLAHVARKPW